MFQLNLILIKVPLQLPVEAIVKLHTPITVGGKSGEADICDMWRDHFYKLLNSSQMVDNCEELHDVSNTWDTFTYNENIKKYKIK